MSDMATAFDKAITDKIDQRAKGLAAIESYKQFMRSEMQSRLDAEHGLATKKVTPEMVRAYVEADCAMALEELKHEMATTVRVEHDHIDLRPEQIPDAIAGLALKAKFGL